MKVLSMAATTLMMCGLFTVHASSAHAQNCAATYNACLKSADAATCQKLKAMCKSPNKTKRMLPSKIKTPKSTSSELMLGNKAKKSLGKIEVVCTSKMVIKKKSIRAKTIAISASDGCQLVLNRVKIKAKQGIIIDGRATITLINSSIKARQVGLMISSNTQIYLVGKSRISGKVSTMVTDNAIAKIHVSSKSKIKGKTKIDDGATLKIVKKYKGKGVVVDVKAKDAEAEVTGGIVIE